MGLNDREMKRLLDLDFPAHLGTIDPKGFPRITPIWFIWEEGAFHMTSMEGKPQLRDLGRDPRASIVIDTEERVSVDGVRQNQQVRARGHAELSTDADGYWTKRITLKYVQGSEGEAKAEERASVPRIAIKLVRTEMIGLGTK